MGLFDMFRKRSMNFCFYSDEETDDLYAFVEKTFGEFEQVLHNGPLPGIAIIPPSEGKDYYKLVTLGLGAYEMPVPADAAGEPSNIELVTYLPADWDVLSHEQEGAWPMAFMRVLVDMITREGVWFGQGHTMSMDAANSPVASNTGLSTIFLTVAKDENGAPLKLNFEDEVTFFQMNAIYPEELKLVDEDGADKLLELMGEEFSPIIDINRKNFCK